MADSPATGLLESLRRVLAGALESVQVRLDLLAVELEQEKRRLLQALLLAALALLLLGVGLVLLVGLLLMLLQESYRLAALAGLGFGFLGGGLALVRLAGRRLASPGGIAAASRGEFARDRQALGRPGAAAPVGPPSAAAGGAGVAPAAAAGADPGGRGDGA
jgi:uncharacterized membrane protein YqjE